MNATQQVVSRAFGTMSEQPTKAKDPHPRDKQAYTAVLLRIVQDSSRPSDADDLADLASKLGYTRQEVEADAETVRCLLHWREAVVLGHRAFEERNRIVADGMKLEREFIAARDALNAELAAYEKRLQTKLQSPDEQSRLKRLAPHLFHDHTVGDPALLCEERE